MKIFLRALLIFSLFGAIPYSCSSTTENRINVDFPTQASRTLGRDQFGEFEDYTLQDTRVRFYLSTAPTSLSTWNGYGTDGGVPRELVSGIFVRSRFGDYEFPSDLFDDLGDPNIRQSGSHEYVTIQQKDESLRIGMANSDGAGGYRVLFEVDLLGGRAQRFVQDHMESTFNRTHKWTTINKTENKSEQATPRKLSD